VLRWAKRLVVGRPMRSERLGETLLPKKLALPVFCSDPLSSNAYATEEILLGLSLGGLALLHLTSWVGLAVIVLLAVVVASYRQTCSAYPDGGGAYAVFGDTVFFSHFPDQRLYRADPGAQPRPLTQNSSTR